LTPGRLLHSRLRGCRRSPKRGFDELSLSGSGSDFKRLLPLTLSLSKGVFDFSDSLFPAGMTNLDQTDSYHEEHDGHEEMPLIWDLPASL